MSSLCLGTAPWLVGRYVGCVVSVLREGGREGGREGKKGGREDIIRSFVGTKFHNFSY